MTGAWAWHLHPVLWGALALVGLAAAAAHRRVARRTDPPAPWPRTRALRFAGGLVLFGVCLGWPLGDLAAHWSLSALVLQRCVLVLGVASLLLSGLSDELIRRLTRPAPVDALLVRVMRPPVAVIVVTVIAVGSMAPAFVVAQSSSDAVRVGFALLAVAAGTVLWLPILGRIPGIPRPRPMIRAVYLVAQAVIPVFLSFVLILAPEPIYHVYAHSEAVIRLRPLNDQQVAGFVSKLSFLFVLLGVAGVELARAPDSDDDLGPEDPLVWADVERHFERLDRRGGPPVDRGPGGADNDRSGGRRRGDLQARPPADGDPGDHGPGGA